MIIDYIKEIPSSLEKPLTQTKEQGRVSVDAHRRDEVLQKEQEIAQQIPWLWFEFTPFEVGCDELGGKNVVLSRCDVSVRS